jgi:hypothetical protein
MLDAQYMSYRIEPHRSVLSIGEALELFRNRFGYEPQQIVCYKTTVLPKELAQEVERSEGHVFEQTIYLGPLRETALPTVAEAPVEAPKKAPAKTKAPTAKAATKPAAPPPVDPPKKAVQAPWPNIMRRAVLFDE